MSKQYDMKRIKRKIGLFTRSRATWCHEPLVRELINDLTRYVLRAKPFHQSCLHICNSAHLEPRISISSSSQQHLCLSYLKAGPSAAVFLWRTEIWSPALPGSEAAHTTWASDFQETSLPRCSPWCSLAAHQQHLLLSSPGCTDLDLLHSLFS